MGIQLHLGGQVMVDIQSQLQPLGAGLGPVHRRHMLAQINQVGWLGRERQLPVLVAAEIEHIVEQTEQLVPACLTWESAEFCSADKGV